jgi:hypothetical protein
LQGRDIWFDDELMQRAEKGRQKENIEHMFLISTKEPFGSLWGIRTEVGRIKRLLTRSQAKQRRPLIDGQIKLMPPAVDAKRAREVVNGLAHLWHVRRLATMCQEM